MLSVRILSPLTRSVLAVLPEAFDARYARQPRTAMEIVAAVPRDAPGLAYATRGNLLEVWRGEELEASGRIEIRDVSGDTVLLTAYTEEIRLKDYVTPAVYGAVLSGKDAADVIRTCLDRWYPIRLKTAKEWGELSEHMRNRRSLGVTVQDAGGGTLWLARDAQGRYVRNGYVAYMFDADTLPGFTGWDRIRWASDYPPDGLVYTTVQYVLSDGGPLPNPNNPEEWLPNVSWESPSTNPQTLYGERGVLPDEIGIDLGGATNRYLHVILRLYTDDQESQEEGETETSGSSPRFYALEVIARTEGEVLEGDIPASTDHTVQAINADSATAFDVIRDACEQANLDFQVVAGALHVAESFGGEDGLHLVTSEGTRVLVAESDEFDIITVDGVPLHDAEGHYYVVRRDS